MTLRVPRRAGTEPAGGGDPVGARHPQVHQRDAADRQPGVILIATIGVLAVGRLGFGVPLPRQPLGFALVVIVSAAAMVALGLLIGALAPTARSAGAAGTVLFFPLMYFAGLWTPQLSATARHMTFSTPSLRTLTVSAYWRSPSTRPSWSREVGRRSATSRRMSPRLALTSAAMLASSSGADCGFGSRIHPELGWAKIGALVEGAALASARL